MKSIFGEVLYFLSSKVSSTFSSVSFSQSVFFALSANSQLSKTGIKSDCLLGGMRYKILVKKCCWPE
jgi:hypothetical protein